MNVVSLSKSLNFNEKYETRRNKIRKNVYDQLYNNRSVLDKNVHDNPTLR